MNRHLVFFVLGPILLGMKCAAFTISSSDVFQSLAINSNCREEALSCDRVTFLKNSFVSIATIASFSPLIVFADEKIDDLSMPSEGEKQAQEAAAMAERLKRKAELQQQARKPMGYTESFEAELRKQKSLEKSKEQRRQALCEELGRGC